MTIHLGGKSIELIYTGRNHSDNSLVVLLPQNKLSSPSTSSQSRPSRTVLCRMAILMNGLSR